MAESRPQGICSGSNISLVPAAEGQDHSRTDVLQYMKKVCTVCMRSCSVPKMNFGVFCRLGKLRRHWRFQYLTLIFKVKQTQMKQQCKLTHVSPRSLIVCVAAMKYSSYNSDEC